jgi:colanic acid/amylovoran biosynthesis glycosyltransferase
MTKIAYITSGKTGLHPFTFRELELLRESNINFVLCFTQLNNGLFMPLKDWDFIVFDKISFFIPLLVFTLSNPIKFYKLLSESIKTNSVKYFIIAIYFYYKLHNVTSIHCQMGDHKLFIGYYLSKILNKPLTTTIHAHELYSELSYKSDHRYSMLLKSCANIITISDFNKNILIEKFGIEKSKIYTMYLYPAHAVKEYKNKVKFLTIGNWVRKKGYDFLFQALQQINADDYIFWIVGGDTHSQDSIDLIKLRDQYGLEKKVVILGYQRSEIVKILLEQCDIFCLPSVTDYDETGNVIEREGIPVALMEAIQHHKPIISTKHSGIPELINEILVEENNIEQLKNAIKHLKNSPDIWDKISTNNYQNLKEHFKEENIIVLIDILKGMINE